MRLTCQSPGCSCLGLTASMGRGRSARAPLSRSRVFSPRTSTTTRVPLTRPRDTRAERSKTLKARTRPGFASRHARPRMLHSACEDGPGQNRAEDRPCRRRSGSRLLSLRSVTVRAAAVSVEAPRPSATLSHFRQNATATSPPPWVGSRRCLLHLPVVVDLAVRVAEGEDLLSLIHI